MENGDGARAVTGKFPFNKHWTLKSVEKFDEMLANKCTMYTFIVYFARLGIPEAVVKQRYLEKKGKLER